MRRRLLDVFFVLSIVVVLVSLNVRAEARPVRHMHPICLGIRLVDGGWTIRCYQLGRR